MSPILELRSASREFGSTRALAPLDLSVEPGQVLGLLGPNGAGKTTLISLMACTLAPSSGNVIVDGEHITNAAQARAARKNISLLPQHPVAAPGFTALDTVEYTAWLKGMPGTRRRHAALEALERVGLASQIKRPLKTLSGGMVQRVHLAAALVCEPRLLLLDEPTVGLDPAQRISFRELVRSLPQTAVLLSTHLVEDVRALESDILVLCEGQAIFRGSAAELEARASADSPGDSRLERGYMTLLTHSEGGGRYASALAS